MVFSVKDVDSEVLAQTLESVDWDYFIKEVKEVLTQRALILDVDSIPEDELS